MGELGGELHVVGGQNDRVALGGQRAQEGDQAGLRRVVEAAGRLVEEQQRGAGRQDDGQGERQSLALRQVTRVRVVADAQQQLGHQRPAGTGPGARVGIGRRALGGHRVRVQQIPRLLRYETHAAYEVPRGGAMRDRPADPHGSGRRFDQADQRREQSGLAGAVPSHQRDGLAGGGSEVDAAERLDATATDGEGFDCGWVLGCWGVGGALA